MRRRPIPPGLPVIIGASLQVFGSLAALAAHLRFDAPYHFPGLWTTRIGTCRLSQAGRAESRRPYTSPLQAGQKGFYPVHDSRRFPSQDIRIDQRRTFRRMA